MWRDPLDELIDELERALPTPASSGNAQLEEIMADWMAFQEQVPELLWGDRYRTAQPINPAPVETPTVPASSMSGGDIPEAGQSADAPEPDRVEELKSLTSRSCFRGSMLP